MVRQAGGRGGRREPVAAAGRRARVHGGVDGDGWLETPERPAVLVGTQEMLLSRALMRGYASSPAVWSTVGYPNPDPSRYG